MTLPPVVKRIDVPCDRPTAFSVFLDTMPAWWPMETYSISKLRGSTAEDLEVDPRPGGTIVETSNTGEKHHWGTFREISPTTYLSLDFHMGEAAENASLVEVTFEQVGAASTRVTLVQSNWEAFGPRAEDMRGGYGSGWVRIFELEYARACAAAAAKGDAA